MVIPPESLIKIAAVAVPQHRGDLLYRQTGSPQQARCPLHPLFQQNLRERPAGVPVEQPGDVIRVVGKPLGILLEGSAVGMGRNILDDFIRQPVRNFRLMLGGVLPGDLLQKGQRQRPQHLLGVLLLIRVFDDHHLQQRPDVAIVFDLHMNVLVRKLVGRRVDQKVEQPGVGGEHRQESPEKGIFLDQHPDNHRLPVVVGAEGVPGKGLPGVQLSLANGNPVVIFVAERVVLPLVGEVEVEKVVVMERLLLTAALVDHNQDVVFRRARPAENLLQLMVGGNILVDLGKRKILPLQRFNCRFQFFPSHETFSFRFFFQYTT